MKKIIKEILFKKANKNKKKKILLNKLDNPVCSIFDTFTVEEENFLIENGYYWNGRSLSKY